MEPVLLLTGYWLVLNGLVGHWLVPRPVSVFKVGRGWCPDGAPQALRNAVQLLECIQVHLGKMPLLPKAPSRVISILIGSSSTAWSASQLLTLTLTANTGPLNLFSLLFIFCLPCSSPYLTLYVLKSWYTALLMDGSWFCLLRNSFSFFHSCTLGGDHSGFWMEGTLWKLSWSIGLYRFIV